MDTVTRDGSSYVGHTTKEAFRNLFVGAPGEVLDPVDFSDGTFGFSFLRKRKEYPDGYVSLFRIYISDEEYKKSSPLKMVTVSVSYGMERDGSVLIASSREEVKKIFDPIDLISENEFYFDIDRRRLIYNGEDITAKRLLEVIDFEHRKPTMRWRGFYLRLKIVFWRVFLVNLLGFASRATVWVLRCVYDAKIQENIWSRIVSRDEVRESVVPGEIKTVSEGKSIVFLGFEASRSAIIFYCIVHLSLFLILYTGNHMPGWARVIFTNNFLTIVYVVLTLHIVESVLPKLLKRFLVGVDRIFVELQNKRIKI